MKIVDSELMRLESQLKKIKEFTEEEIERSPLNVAQLEGVLAMQIDTLREQLKNEKIQARITLLKAYNNYIINEMGNEDYFDEWLQNCIPDCPTEEDYECIAYVDEDFEEITGIYASIIQRSQEEEQEEFETQFEVTFKIPFSTFSANLEPTAQEIDECVTALQDGHFRKCFVTEIKKVK